MDMTLKHALMHLSQGAFMPVADGAGKCIAVFHGLVWITQEADPRDTFVRAGESFTFDRPGLAIVQALEPTRLVLFEGEANVDHVGYEAAWPHHEQAQHEQQGAAVVVRRIGARVKRLRTSATGSRNETAHAPGWRHRSCL